MNKYYLTVIGNTQNWTTIVEAEYFLTTTGNTTTSGYYGFYNKTELVACYPINRTFINKVERDNDKQ